MRFPSIHMEKIDRNRLPVPAMSDVLTEENYVAPQDDLEAQLVRVWEEILQVHPIGIQDDFFELGGHSLLAANLFTRIENALGMHLPLATLFDAPTIAAQAKLLRQEGWDAYFSPLVAVQPDGLNPILFCMAAHGGNVLTYRDLSLHLGNEQPVYALQSRGLDGIDEILFRVEDIAADFIAAMRAIQPHGPYYVCGSSFGGLVAYEVACQLEQQDLSVGLVAMFDTFGPGHPKKIPGLSRTKLRLYSQIERVDLHFSNLVHNDWKGRWNYVKTKGYRLWRRYRNWVVRSIREARQPIPESILKVQRANAQAQRDYVPGDYQGHVVLFQASKLPTGRVKHPTMGWEKLVHGNLQVHEIQGQHGALVYEPQVRNLAPVFKQCLAEAQERNSPK